MKLETYQRVVIGGVEQIEPDLTVRFATRGNTHVTRSKMLNADDEIPIDHAFAAQLLGAAYRPCVNIGVRPSFLPPHKDLSKQYVYRQTPTSPDGPFQCICGTCGYAAAITPDWGLTTCRHPDGFSAIQSNKLNEESRAPLPPTGLGWREEKIVEDDTDGRLIIAFGGMRRITDKYMRAIFPNTTLRFTHVSGDFAIATYTGKLAK